MYSHNLVQANSSTPLDMSNLNGTHSWKSINSIAIINQQALLSASCVPDAVMQRQKNETTTDLNAFTFYGDVYHVCICICICTLCMHMYICACTYKYAYMYMCNTFAYICKINRSCFGGWLGNRLETE